MIVLCKARGSATSHSLSINADVIDRLSMVVLWSSHLCGKAKKYTNKSSRDNNRWDASLHLIFKKQGFYENCTGMHLICYHPYYSCCAFFGLTIPTYFFNLLFSCFLYLLHYMAGKIDQYNRNTSSSKLLGIHFVFEIALSFKQKCAWNLCALHPDCHLSPTQCPFPYISMAP